MIAGHRWEYRADLRLSECVPLPVGGVESYQWCIGCGATVDDLELARLNLPRNEVWLDQVVHTKGYYPLEAGTEKADRYLRGKQ